MELPRRSAIFRAVEQAIRVGTDPRRAANERHLLYSYTDPDDFQRMWSTHDAGEQSDTATSQLLDSTTPATFVIVWDGVPPNRPGTPRIRDPLTPVDWTIAFSWRSIAHRNVPPFRVLILDASSTNREGSGREQLYDLFVRNSDAIPWMTVFRARDTGLARLLESMNDTHEQTLDPKKPATAKFNTIREVWRDQLLSAGDGDDHHLLANRIGPQMLTETNCDDLHSKALCNMVTWICWNDEPRNLLTSEPSSLVKPAVSPRPWQELLEFAVVDTLPALRLLLVDDFAFSGWAQFLARYLDLKTLTDGHPSKDGAPVFFAQSADGRIRLDVTQDPIWLLKEIFATDGPPNVSDRRFTLRLGEPPGVHHTTTLLLLDLRLFQDALSANALAFIRRVLTSARAYVSCNNSPPWRQFDCAQFAAIETWLTAPTVRDLNYGHALSLFPRLIAQIDPSLPIGLFSSTAWRPILKSLGAYGNILTHFEKPGADSWRRGGSGIESTLANLDTLIETGLAFSLGRRKAFRLIDRHARPDATRRKFRHIEFYLDESKPKHSNRWRVGGCIAIFEGTDQQEAMRKANIFDDVCAAQGIVFCKQPLPLSPLDPRLVLKSKDDFVHDELRAAMTHDCRPSSFGLFELRDNPSRKLIKSQFFEPSSFDNPVFYLLNSAIELFLCDLVPTFAGKDNLADVSLSVFIGTRAGPFSTEADDDILRRYEYDYRFGFERRRSSKGRVFYQTVRPEAVYPMVATILRRHGITLTLERALAMRLPYESHQEEHQRDIDSIYCLDCKMVLRRKRLSDGKFGDFNILCKCREPRTPVERFRPNVRCLHYVADQLLSDHSKYNELLDWKCVDELNDNMERALHASLALDRGNPVLAMWLVPMPAENSCSPTYTGVDALTQRIAWKLHSLSGVDFLRFVRGVRDMPKLHKLT